MLQIDQFTNRLVLQTVPAKAASLPFLKTEIGSECLVCPNCEVPLGPAADKLDCPSCGQHWPVVDGVPHFVSEFPYWGASALGRNDPALLTKPDPAARLRRG
jgi:hypothetical protein